MSKYQFTNELRLGNLILQDNHLCKVVSISEIGVAVEVIQKAEQSTNSGQKSRIRINKEWLMKLGGYHRALSEWDIDGECYSYNFENQTLVYTGGEGISLSQPIQYIHTLQNFHFFCHGRELKFNL
jgi:hypothetical protein